MVNKLFVYIICLLNISTLTRIIVVSAQLTPIRFNNHLLTELHQLYHQQRQQDRDGQIRQQQYLYKNNSQQLPYPIILVPGDGGNQLYAKLNKSTGPHYFCQQKSKDYFELWLNLESLSPYVIDCFIDNMRLIYDNKTHKSNNVDGVDLKTINFGHTETVEYLDSSHIYGTSYFSTIVTQLVAKFNYTRGVNILGAPYDWRKSPLELDDFFNNLTNMLINAYESSNQTKVVLIGHSMGNPIILYWLKNYLTQEQKDKYIRVFFSLAPVLGGAAKPLRLMASGDNIDVVVVRPLTVRPYQRSAPSTAWLMPSPSFWSPDEILVSRPTQNYTVNDYLKFFQDLNFMDGYYMRQDTQNLIINLDPPNVEYHALYGVGVKTPEQFQYTAAQWPDSQPSVVYGDGDGTVNIRSLLGYKRWMGKQKQDIYFKEFKGVDHLAILHDSSVIDYISNFIINN